MIKSKVLYSDLRNQSGQILILTFIALGLVLFTVLFVISGAQIYFLNAQYFADAEKATALAEAGVDKALASLNKTGGSYNGEQETFFGDGSYSVEITNKDAVTKILYVTGYLPNKTNPKVRKKVTIQVSKGVGISFNYGLQVGNGGITIGTGSILNGSIYSNGNISGENDSNLRGDVYVAGAGQAAADQQSDCFGANCQDYIFGKNVNGESRQDVAQSFKPSEGGVLNKVSLKLMKVGSPANAIVKVMSDASGKPNKNEVLATGTLLANLVSTEAPPAFADVTFNTTPQLNRDTTYWIMVHSISLDNLNYWVWSLDLGQGYAQGVPKWSANWQTGNPLWGAIAGDLGFQTYMGGAPTSIHLGNGSTVSGSVHANTIGGSMTINRDAYYQTIEESSVVVNGIRYPGSADPPPAVFPVSEANISEWQNQAEEAGFSEGGISGCVATLGPGKIEGDVSLGNSCNVKVFSPVWITGNLTTGNSVTLTLDSSFGEASGLVIVGGITDLGNGSDLLGSDPGSYLMLLSTYDSRLNGNVAIRTGNTLISGILYAPYGKVELSNGANFREVTAYEIGLGNHSILNYQSGLASTLFLSGPAGSFSLVKGTYQVR